MIKKLLKSLRENKLYTILTMVSMIFEVAMEVTIPLIIFEFGKCVSPGPGIDPDINGMIIYGCLMVGAAILSLLAGMKIRRKSVRWICQKSKIRYVCESAKLFVCQY